MPRDKPDFVHLRSEILQLNKAEKLLDLNTPFLQNLTLELFYFQYLVLKTNLSYLKKMMNLMKSLILHLILLNLLLNKHMPIEQ